MDAAQALGQFQPKETVTLKAGTIVKVGGFPFRLMADTPVEGHHLNLQQVVVGMGQPTIAQAGYGGMGISK